ncbi:hypothetical protein DSL72_001967 [Monilinia vaccinii-corymbosi]|uniref:Uncharacterized protein n=1 Tax=Monilinia vaccinii-corymbosi TaxID=61207 RepID=A0A8A3PBB6_9HELO|nr:hypothetical protein DSL72_001967 [Monilinia vaccinii-corymbosi]
MANQQILASSTQHKHLLSILSRTDHAPSEYAQIIQYQSSIEGIISQQERRVEALAAVSAKEHREHEEYQDSTVKRLAYKLSGRKHKFMEKGEQEHREWLNAIQNELEARRHLDHLNDTLEEAKSKASSLKPLVEEHNAAQAELDTLYNLIFSGPSPDFPTEDRMEHRLTRARDSFNEAQLRLSTESNVLFILQNASTVMNQCIATLDGALQSSIMEAWGVGGGFADMTERPLLAQAQSLSSKVEMLVSQARQMQPAVQILGPMSIAQSHLMPDVHDNMLHDIKCQDKIEESKRQVVAARARLIQETERSSERLIKLRGKVEEKKKNLEMRRRELQDERAKVFEGVMTEGVMTEKAMAEEATAEKAMVTSGILNDSQRSCSIVQVEHAQSKCESPRQCDGQQLLHYSLFGAGYQEQSHEPEPEPYRIPPAGTYDFQPVSPNYPQQDLAMPVPSWYT